VVPAEGSSIERLDWEIDGKICPMPRVDR